MKSKKAKAGRCFVGFAEGYGATSNLRDNLSCQRNNKKQGIIHENKLA